MPSLHKHKQNESTISQNETAKNKSSRTPNLTESQLNTKNHLNTVHVHSYNTYFHTPLVSLPYFTAINTAFCHMGHRNGAADTQGSGHRMARLFLLYIFFFDCFIVIHVSVVSGRSLRTHPTVNANESSIKSVRLYNTNCSSSIAVGRFLTRDANELQ